MDLQALHLPALGALERAWEAVEKAEQLRETAKEEMTAALEKIQDALVTLALQIGEDFDLRDRIIQHLYWMEPDIKTTWLAEAFGIKSHQIVEIAGAASILVPCSRCGQEYQIVVTSRSMMQSALQMRSRSAGYVTSMCETCKELTHREWQATADVDRRKKEARLQQLRTMPYREYLLTSEWNARREQQLRRAGYRCQVCNASRKQLNVHHRTYERRGNEEFKDLIVLCKDCHSIFHSLGRLAQE